MHTSWSTSLLISLIALVIYLWGWARIFSKAGHSWWFAFLWLVPFVNVVLFLWFAFSREWKVQRDLREAQEELRRLKGA